MSEEEGPPFACIECGEEFNHLTNAEDCAEDDKLFAKWDKESEEAGKA